YRLTVTPDAEAGATEAAAPSLAMRQLLTRVTGARDPTADPELARIIANAGELGSYSGSVGRDSGVVGFYSNRNELGLEALGATGVGAGAAADAVVDRDRQRRRGARAAVVRRRRDRRAG